jgi:hypothetical protein
MPPADNQHIKLPSLGPINIISWFTMAERLVHRHPHHGGHHSKPTTRDSAAPVRVCSTVPVLLLLVPALQCRLYRGLCCQRVLYRDLCCPRVLYRGLCCPCTRVCSTGACAALHTCLLYRGLCCPCTRVCSTGACAAPAHVFALHGPVLSLHTCLLYMGLCCPCKRVCSTWACAATAHVFALQGTVLH